MPSQELQWMAVPYDVEQRDSKTFLKVAVCVTPRLQDVNTNDNKLSDYPEWVDWPATLNNVGIGLEVQGQPVISGSALTPIDEQADSGSWKAVFQSDSLVRPYEYVPFTDFKIMSFNVKDILGTVNGTYKSLLTEFGGDEPVLEMPEEDGNDNKSLLGKEAKLFTALKSITPNTDQVSKLNTVKRSWEASGLKTTKLRSASQKSGQKKVATTKLNIKDLQLPSSPIQMMYAAPMDVKTALGGLQMVDLYHTSRSFANERKVGRKVFRDERPKVKVPEFDFHQIVSVLREFPILMRKLGLVRHVEFELPGSMPTSGKIRCKITWPSGGATTTKTLIPWTAYKLDKSGDAAYWQFLPRPDADSEIIGPVLCLNDNSHFDVVQVDVDTAAIKTLNYTKTITDRVAATKGTRDANTRAEPPSTRGTGLQLVRVNRGLKLAKMLLRNADNMKRVVNNQEVTLYADDLLRGYRIDVYDDTAKTWQSLMRRNATYTLPKATGAMKSPGITVLDEEGVLTMAATRSVDSDDDDDQKQLYAHETIAQWEGWSMVVPPIGNFIGTEDELAPASTKQTPPSNFSYQVETDVKIVPGSLPRLRFGRYYRMRARFVDIAGNGPKLNELNPTDFTCATELVRYLRWDPIVSPTLALRKHPVEGESLERLVIRNYNADEDDSVEVDTTETNERHVFPPLAAGQIIERHGLLDSSEVGGMKGDNGTYDMMVKFSGQLPARWYTRNDAGDLVPEATDNKAPTDPEKAKTAISFPYVPGGSTETPYLPDPMARTVTLNGVPGVAAGQLKQITLSGETMASISSASGVVTIAFDDNTSSPSNPSRAFKPVTSILLKVVGGSGAPTWDAGTRTLTILLPKGEQAWIKFSSGLGSDQNEADENFTLHGHKQTLIESGSADAKLKAAARGLSWLISPARTLHIIHATQKPIKKPQTKKGAVTRRDFGDTNAEINLSEIYVHAKTTQKIDMFAEWDMEVDNIRKPEPEVLKQSAYFFEQHIENLKDDTLATKKVQEYGDTKYRAINYVPLATSRFREHMPKTIRNDSKNLTRKGIGKELDILNSKRPDGVKLLYIIPSFRWEGERTLQGNIVRSKRKGGGLRVYMERPWFSSGNGELLGVVLYSTDKFVPAKTDKGSGKGVKGFKAPVYDKKSMGAKYTSQQAAALMAGGKLDIPEPVQPYVTQWGLDPIWLSAPTPSDNSPRPTNFRDPEIVLSNISMAETDAKKQRYTVVGYKPAYDKERQLWYCDIEMDPGESYYPFIRLALVRLQPKSLEDDVTGEDVYCSRITQSEFCQLAPDREATVRIEDDRRSITVQVVGHTYRINAAGQLGSEIEVSVEKKDAGAGGDLGWTPVVTQRIDRINAAGMWGGMVKLPESVDATSYRVVIKEYEQFYSDPSDPKERETSLGSKTANTGDVKLEYDRRIVYADVLPLS